MSSDPDYSAAYDEHSVDPGVVDRGRYRAPTVPGMGAAMPPQMPTDFWFPDSAGWPADPSGDGS